MIEDFLNTTQPPPAVCLALFLGLVILAFYPKKRKARAAKKSKDPLDAVIFRWSDTDALTVRDLVAGGIHAFGGTGSGKTSSLDQIAAAIMRHGNGAC